MIKISNNRLTCAVSAFNHANSELFRKSVSLKKSRMQKLSKNSCSIFQDFLLFVLRIRRNRDINTKF